MLRFLAKRIVASSFIPLEARGRSIHITTTLGKSIKCFRSKYSACKTEKKCSCSPTDPPVRPCCEEDCSRPKYPCCVNARIAENPCSEAREDDKFISMWEEYKDRKETPRPETMWHYPEECCPPCGDIRFDVLYYRPSNKCRDYQRTWWECCPKMVPKRVCCWCDAIPPEVLRRDLPLCPRSACSSEHEEKRLKCLNENSKCMRLRMPCCRAARVPPSCDDITEPSDCEKIRCPFPSYSECVQEDPAVIPTRPPECECLEKMSMCEQIRRAQHLAKHNTSIWPCCRSKR
ncbi:uncharacterized protein LOC108113455 [Drosophila eugracilis]|uniref:uncharacterized protein LOC108113455 n=1 Tax=Drosophila eugracilis TaxID=29029 RepID=UPI0007E668E3|nr:uncharacterized protein LOC108113455 [Drosophila eugracilis]